MHWWWSDDVVEPPTLNIKCGLIYATPYLFRSFTLRLVLFLWFDFVVCRVMVAGGPGVHVRGPSVLVWSICSCSRSMLGGWCWCWFIREGLKAGI